jgi:hypothetical protein
MAFRVARDCPLTHSNVTRRPLHMIELTETREISPYVWVHPDDER